jgi:hypothetical protein
MSFIKLLEFCLVVLVVGIALTIGVIYNLEKYAKHTFQHNNKSSNWIKEGYNTSSGKNDQNLNSSPRHAILKVKVKVKRY